MSYAIKVLNNAIVQIQNELIKAQEIIDGDHEMVSSLEFALNDKENLDKQLIELQEALKKII